MNRDGIEMGGVEYINRVERLAPETKEHLFWECEIVRLL